MSMERLIAEFARERLGETEPCPPALIVEALRDQAAFYGRHIPFAVGDLVTPRKGTTMKGAGEAHIVIATRKEAEYDLRVGEPGHTNHGKRLDMRVLSWMRGYFAAHWVESAEFEAWVDPHAADANESATAA